LAIITLNSFLKHCPGVAKQIDDLNPEKAPGETAKMLKKLSKKVLMLFYDLSTYIGAIETS